MRKTPFLEGEFYHIYNRGVDKRNIFGDQEDIKRFMQSMIEFNVTDPIGSIYENSFILRQLGSETSKSSKLKKPEDKLVEFIAYCLNPNHFHFILENKKDGGVSEFIKRLSGGYTKYFNNKYKRTGVLFQGVFKSVHVSNNAHFLYLSAYVNLNNEVHKLGRETSKFVRRSFEEYEQNLPGLCKKEIIFEQFKSPQKYAQEARKTVKEISRKRREDKELERILFE